MGFLIPVSYESMNGLSQGCHTVEAGPPDGLSCEYGKPGLDLIEPRCRGRGEMHLVSWASGEPLFHLGMLVRAIVVKNQVKLACRVVFLHEP